MIERTGIKAIWAIMTFMMLAHGSISIEYAYIGSCMMLVAGLLHKGE